MKNAPAPTYHSFTLLWSNPALLHSIFVEKKQQNSEGFLLFAYFWWKSRTDKGFI